MRFLFFAFVLLSSTPSHARDDIQLGWPGYGGNGCPQNSASVSLSPDQKTLSILFDQYIAEAGGATGKRLDRKFCNISIPVSVPQGYSISIFKVDYRGFNALARGTRSQFNVEYHFGASRGVRMQRAFFGPLSEDYLIENYLGAEALVWSACGAKTNLRVNTNMLVQTNARMEQVMSTVDSADIEAGLIYHLQWRECH